jgi:hypothetical protein
MDRTQHVQHAGRRPASGDADGRPDEEAAVTTLAEDLVLLLVDPVSGRTLVGRDAVDRGIAGALLLDLALRARLAVDGRGRRMRIAVVNAAPTGEPVVDVALAELGREPVSARSAAEHLARRVREPVLERLAERGLAYRVHQRRLGLPPAQRWEVPGEGVRGWLCAGLERTLLHEQPPDVRLACLIALLHAARADHRVVDGPPRRVRARAAEVVAAGLGGAAERGAVAAIWSAVVLNRPHDPTADAASRPGSFS